MASKLAEGAAMSVMSPTMSMRLVSQLGDCSPSPRTEGDAGFYAYGVLNDAITSDGSVVGMVK